ncbi:MAG: response regulator [Bacteroidia bacterium]
MYITAYIFIHVIMEQFDVKGVVLILEEIMINRVLLVEDHNIVRDGIRLVLGLDENLQVVAEATNGEEALELLDGGLEVDIVLTDINMPEMDGLTMLKELKTNFPRLHVIILSMHDNERYITEAFMAGASGYLLKNVSADELLFTLKHIQTGAKYLCSELTMKLVDKLLIGNYGTSLTPSSGIDFSLREVEVLNLIANGLTNAEMAEKLFISKRTIEGHRQSLVDKTGTKNTASLIRYAVLHGVIR